MCMIQTPERARNATQKPPSLRSVEIGMDQNRSFASQLPWDNFAPSSSLSAAPLEGERVSLEPVDERLRSGRIVVSEGHVSNHCRRTRSRSGSRSLKEGVESSPGLRPLGASLVGGLGGGEFQLDGASNSFTSKPNALIFLHKATRIRRKSRKSLSSI
jgi:hypothetical protein